MPLRTFAGRIISWQSHKKPPEEAPLCGCEPGTTRWADCGSGFPEILEHHRMPCAEPAVSVVSFSCPCGHEGHRYSCAEHAAPGPCQKCGHCAEDFMHLCPVTLRAVSLGRI